MTRPTRVCPVTVRASVLVAALGCASEGPREGGSGIVTLGGSGVGSEGDDTDVGATAGSGGATDPDGGTPGASTDPDGSGGVSEGIFDVGGGEGGLESGPEFNDDECQKIDFLFVIDNSGSMANEQAALIASFPGFIDAIEATVNAQNYQLMVIDTDEASAGLCTELCQTFPTCFGTPCNAIPEPTACDVTLGAGVIKDAQGVPCDIDGAERYLVESQTDLDATFECIARVGIGGQDIERPMEAMAAAVGPQLGGCNQGFLRDDAILVVTFITDEEDDGDSLGDPAAWKAALVAAKGGNEEAIVVLGLVGDSDVPGGGCGPFGLAEPSPRLRAFADAFAFGSWDSICAPDYAPFFGEAVGVIDSACEIFDPEG